MNAPFTEQRGSSHSTGSGRRSLALSNHSSHHGISRRTLAIHRYQGRALPTSLTGSSSHTDDTANRMEQGTIRRRIRESIDDSHNSYSTAVSVYDDEDDDSTNSQDAANFPSAETQIRAQHQPNSRNITDHESQQYQDISLNDNDNNSLRKSTDHEQDNISDMCSEPEDSNSTFDSAEAREAAIQAGFLAVIISYVQNDVFQKVLAFVSKMCQKLMKKFGKGNDQEDALGVEDLAEEAMEEAADNANFMSQSVQAIGAGPGGGGPGGGGPGGGGGGGVAPGPPPVVAGMAMAAASSAAAGAAAASSEEKIGYVELQIASIPPSVLEANKQDLEDLFQDIYNEMSGMCLDPMQRVMIEAVLQEWETDWGSTAT
ncbi:hypothetical protein SEMRO_8_G006560.1 [Seminavis robusta]|uniref:Uncharacterized protein n=1 Tax=Seminavis robusta TaxID=568900 RepID=A0A9N8D5W2_9STRA|nr:hypothetical protein SEMRO_8_G006560.1 [Seminavis robusta]|eukprot:Sro8_g006560.1 n/a (372) ;mRNA; f:58847-60172